MAETAIEEHTTSALAMTQSNRIIMKAVILIGAAGAITSVTGDSGIGATDGGTGITDVTFPACESCVVFGQILFAGSSVDDQFVTVGAVSATAGTASIRCWDVSGAAVADITSGDSLQVLIVADAT